MPVLGQETRRSTVSTLDPSVLLDNEYRCAECGVVFEKGWTDDEAAEEAAHLFPGVIEKDMAMVCDDCFKKITGGVLRGQGT